MNFKQLKQDISEHYCIDEAQVLSQLRALLQRHPDDLQQITDQALRISRGALVRENAHSALQSLLKEYQLSTDEGVALMALTEALLRIPDQAVAAQLIADRIRPLNWGHHLHKHNPFMVNASTLMLMLTGRLLTRSSERSVENYAHTLLRRVSQPFIHEAMKRVIEVISAQFVFAENIEQAHQQIADHQPMTDLFSLDMLGESALNRADAEGFYQKYLSAIDAIIAAKLGSRTSISIKLSALHPRFEARHQAHCVPELVARLIPLVRLANDHLIDLTIDAEEADRLELGLAVFTQLFTSSAGGKSAHLGLAVQAYSPRALPLLRYLQQLAETSGRKMAIRLVKGAYWDSEVKQAQIDGLAHYPVFTQKHHTELSYLACADYLLANRHCFYPQFATHNAVTISDILQQAQPDESYEFQRLHGMGEAIYEQLRVDYPNLRVRIYEPVGRHDELLPYLVRRVLENGANNSFLKRLTESEADLERLCQHPLATANQASPELLLPSAIYQPERANSKGLNLASIDQQQRLSAELTQWQEQIWQSEVIVSDQDAGVELVDILSPYDDHWVGTCHLLGPQHALEALGQAHAAFASWRHRPAKERAQILVNYAQLLEKHQYELLSLLIRESGKTVSDALNELRETIDFAYYYAHCCEVLCGEPRLLPSVTGEQNLLEIRGRGVFLCISPWNFPLAIFSGQVCAALAAGNTVIAKPAERTPLVARLAVSLLYEAGIPETVLHYLPGSGALIGPVLGLDKRLAGVAFTGSTKSAQAINQTLSKRTGAMIPLIAETGGQNAMIVDSSALPEQVVRDVLKSAFYSAGQRCSALRVLYLQREIAPTIIQLLQGAMKELRIGDPGQLATDLGPVISANAKYALERHILELRKSHHLIYACDLDAATNRSNLVAPHAFEIDSIHQLSEEHFGPILHVIRYDYAAIDQVVNDINDYGYGLTCGLHSRNESWARTLAQRLNVGNIYLNRDMVGAVVGAQPFGGQGLSGTGPKAGGPHYLLRFATETTITTNLSAVGGNVSLIMQQTGSH